MLITAKVARDISITTALVDNMVLLTHAPGKDLNVPCAALDPANQRNLRAPAMPASPSVQLRRR
jgi:hypothetical protein